MLCSSYNARLDEYVEGTLSIAQSARIAAHVATCADCAALLEELRVIDALLIKPRVVDAAPNFTFAVMAEVRAMRAPHPRHRFTFASIGAYIVFAWVAIASFLLLGGHTARSAFASLGTAFATVATGSGVLAGAVARVFGQHTFGVTAAMAALLGFDLCAAALVFATFGYFRARRVAAERNFE